MNVIAQALSGARKGSLIRNSQLTEGAAFSEQLLYLIDFGISTPYVDSGNGKLLPQKVMRNIRCSPQYAGLNQLNGMSKPLAKLHPLIGLCRRDDIEAFFYTIVALLRIKLTKVSSYQSKMQTDLDLIRMLGSIKDPKQLESQKELLLIKEVKRNLNEKFMRAYLPAGFSDFFAIMESIDYYGKPEYDKLARVLEKARDSIPFFPPSKVQQLVDAELFEMDPIFLKFNEQLARHRKTQVKQSYSSLAVTKQVGLPKIEQKLSSDNVQSFLKRKNCLKFDE